MIRFVKSERGYSLVELAMSVTIIGVLLAAVLKGREILDNSRIAAMASKIGKYEAGLTSFADLYGELPGDMADADKKIPACAAAPDACTFIEETLGGDGDGLIEGVNDITGHAKDAHESLGFWEHLSASGIVRETRVGAGEGNVVGVNVPRTPFGGGFTLMLSPDVSDDGGLLSVDTVGAGLYLRAARNAEGDFGDPGVSLVTPLVASAFDRKVDDGLPGSGIVLASNNSSAECQSEDSDQYEYATATTSKDCDLLIKFGD